MTLPNSVVIESCVCFAIGIGWFLRDRYKKKDVARAKKALRKATMVRPKHWHTDGELHVLSEGTLQPLFMAKQGRL